MPPVASWMNAVRPASSAPRSVVRTPATCRSAPSGSDRAVAIGDRRGSRRRGRRRRGLGVGGRRRLGVGVGRVGGGRRGRRRRGAWRGRRGRRARRRACTQSASVMAVAVGLGVGVARVRRSGGAVRPLRRRAVAARNATIQSAALSLRVDAVAERAAGSSLEARAGGRRRRGRPFDERVRRVAPADRIDDRAADDPQRDRAARRGEPAACRPRRRSPRTHAGAVHEQEPRCPASRIVDAAHVALRVTVEPDEVAYTTSSPIRSTGRGALVRDLDELVRCLAPAGLDLGHDERRRRPRDRRRLSDGRRAGGVAAGTPDRHEATTRDERGVSPRAGRVACVTSRRAIERAAAPVDVNQTSLDGR